MAALAEKLKGISSLQGTCLKKKKLEKKMSAVWWNVAVALEMDRFIVWF